MCHMKPTSRPVLGHCELGSCETIFSLFWIKIEQFVDKQIDLKTVCSNMCTTLCRPQRINDISPLCILFTAAGGYHTMWNHKISVRGKQEGPGWQMPGNRNSVNYGENPCQGRLPWFGSSGWKFKHWERKVDRFNLIKNHRFVLSRIVFSSNRIRETIISMAVFFRCVPSILHLPVSCQLIIATMYFYNQ